MLAKYTCGASHKFVEIADTLWPIDYAINVQHQAARVHARRRDVLLNAALLDIHYGRHLQKSFFNFLNFCFIRKYIFLTIF